jgi:hypothetical protein
MKTAYHAEQHSVWFGIARFLFVLLLAAIFFLIGESMARHRFHQGGRDHRNGSVGQ